jgi:hypothetical protein
MLCAPCVRPSLTSDTAEEATPSLWAHALRGEGSERGKKGFRCVACDEVTVKAVPVVEPQRLSDLTGLMPPQVYILKMSLPTQRVS